MNSSAQRNSVFQDEIPNFVQGEKTNYVFNLKASYGNKVRIARQPSSSWFETLKDRFDDLSSLSKGWDGYRGQAVKFTCAQFAANLLERLFDSNLPPPSLVPGSDGTIQIEWHRNQYDIEIDVLAPYEVVATRFDKVSGLSEELDLQSDFTDLAVWIADLATDRNTDLAVGKNRR